MGWMNNWIYANEVPTATWRGQITIPRIMNLISLDPSNPQDPQYRVTSTPVPELESLRNPSEQFETSEPFIVPAQTLISLTDLASWSSTILELEIILEIRNQAQFSLCAYNNLGEESCFGYNATKWYLDRSKSGNVGFSGEYEQTLVATATREVFSEQVAIRLYLDVSSLEVFTDNGLIAMTALHYPSQPFDKIYINHWSSTGSSAEVKVIKANLWGLKCWYPEK